MANNVMCQTSPGTSGFKEFSKASSQLQPPSLYIKKSKFLSGGPVNEQDELRRSKKRKSRGKSGKTDTRILLVMFESLLNPGIMFDKSLFNNAMVTYPRRLAGNFNPQFVEHPHI